jgi:hypothetical protein
VSTVPIFAPDGTLGDIPAERLEDAVKSGAKPGVSIISPNGVPGVVPADRYADGVRAGVKLAPQEENQAQSGFWSALGSDIKGMIQGLPSALGMALPSGDPRVMAAQMRMRSEAMSAVAQNLESEKQAGYSARYRAAAVAAQSIGVNVPGMEQAAAQGDPGAVLGHAAAVPAVMAASARLGPTAKGMRQGLRAVREGMNAPAPQSAPLPAAGLGPQATTPQPVTIPESGFGAPSGISNPLHGESALSNLLTQLDNPTLLKIAQSRGISTSQLRTLKPGVGNPQLVKSIVADFSPDELNEISAQALENSRFQHNFGNISDEAWRTLALQSYFPNIKVPLAQLRRAAISIQKAGK